MRVDESDGVEGRMLWMGNVQADWSQSFVISLFVGGSEPESRTVPVEVAIRRNAFRVSPDNPSVGFALVTFGTPEAANKALHRLHDTPVPNTESKFFLRKYAATLRSVENRNSVSDSVSTQAQLAPLDVHEIRRRLEIFDVTSDPKQEQQVREQGGNGALRLWLLQRLTEVHEISGKANEIVSNVPTGVPRTKAIAVPEVTTLSLTPETITKCLEMLRTTEWPRVSDRVAVNSESYVSLSSLPNPNARRRRRMKKYQLLWDAAFKLLASVTGQHTAHEFDGLAVTKNVRGSPHIDALDVAAQFAVSLGDFEATGDGDKTTGGMLCVETSPTSVVAIDTHNKIAAIDGRFVHWVDPEYTGERFSLVWYKRSLDAKDWEEPTHAMHEEFWDAEIWSAVEGESPSAKSWVHTRAREKEREGKM